MNPTPERGCPSIAALYERRSPSAFPDGVGAGADCLHSAPALAAVFLILTCSLPAHAWGGKVKLARKYQPGQRMVYQTRLQTRATVRSSPPGLKAFLPSMPTEISSRQQNTVTVRAVRPDGAAEVEHHFDTFEFQSNLPELLPEEVSDTARAAQQEFSKQLSGQTLTARYDPAGRLLGFEGADGLLQELDPPLRETARQVLRVFLEQMGGHALYPDHRVKRAKSGSKRSAFRPLTLTPSAWKAKARCASWARPGIVA